MKELRNSACERRERERERGWGRVIAASVGRKRRQRRGEYESERELPVCLWFVCVCVHAQHAECMCTDTWCSPSLAAHIVESSLPVWAILYLSLSLTPTFPFYPFLLSFVFLPFSLCSFFPSPWSYDFLLFRISLTMVQDFYSLGAYGAPLTKVSRMNGSRRVHGWMHCMTVDR